MITLLHGSANPSLTIEDVQIVGRTDAKQGKKYGGFYVVADRAVAERYANMMPGEPTVYTVSLRAGSKIYHMEERGAVERLSSSAIDELVRQGYSVVSGLNVFGRTMEYAVINKQAIMTITKGVQCNEKVLCSRCN